MPTDHPVECQRVSWEAPWGGLLNFISGQCQGFVFDELKMELKLGVTFGPIRDWKPLDFENV